MALKPCFGLPASRKTSLAAVKQPALVHAPHAAPTLPVN